jgi:hypothetical protein
VVIGQLDSLHHEPVFEKLTHVVTYRERDKGTNERITHANIYKVIAGSLGNLLAKVATESADIDEDEHFFQNIQVILYRFLAETRRFRQFGYGHFYADLMANSVSKSTTFWAS